MSMTAKLTPEEIIKWVEENAVYIHPYNPTWQHKLKGWQAQLAQIEENHPSFRKRLIEFMKSYKDVAESNALAETPEESADYIISLFEEGK